MEMESERFERRLVEDFSGLRAQMVQFESGIRQEMAIFASGLRKEMAILGSGLRGEIAATRVNLFKWCLLCWVGQLLAIGGLLAVMLRLAR